MALAYNFVLCRRVDNTAHARVGGGAHGGLTTLRAYEQFGNVVMGRWIGKTEASVEQ